MGNTDLNPGIFGWKKSADGYLFPNPGYVQICPDSVLDNVVCSCSTGCEDRRCGCRKLQLPCNAACACADNCTNNVNDIVEAQEPNEEDDVQDDEDENEEE